MWGVDTGMVGELVEGEGGWIDGWMDYVLTYISM